MSVTYNRISLSEPSPQNVKFKREMFEYVASDPSGPPPWSIDVPAPEVPADVEVSYVSVEGIQCLKTSSGGSGSKAVLYIHGGGWIAGSMDDGLLILPELTHRSGIDGYSIEYSLRPEAVYPTQLMECVRVFRGLLSMGYRQIAITGVSAGANLCLVLTQYLRDHGLPLPVCIASMSAGLDFSGAIEIQHPDFLLNDLPVVAAEYAKNADVRDPYVSPYFADYRGFPPTLLQAGTGESLHEWHIALARRLEAENADISVELSLWEGMTHGFALEGSYYPEGYAGRDQVIEYILGHFA